MTIFKITGVKCKVYGYLQIFEEIFIISDILKFTTDLWSGVYV